MPTDGAPEINLEASWGELPITVSAHWSNNPRGRKEGRVSNDEPSAPLTFLGEEDNVVEEPVPV